MRDSVREQWQVTRLLAAAVNPSCGGTQLGKSVTPRTLHSVADVVTTSSGMKKNVTDEEKPQRHWTAVSSVKTTDGASGMALRVIVPSTRNQMTVYYCL